MMQIIKIPNQMSNKEFTRQVVDNGIEIAKDEFGRKFVGAFDKTYYVDGDSCSRMTPAQWIECHEDFRRD